MKVPQTDPKAGYLAHQAEIDGALGRALASGWYILGQETAAFEKEFAAFVGVAHGLGVASGTDALVVALRACGVRPGDGVITVAHTAVATVAAVELAGAVPILADIDPLRFTLSPASLENTIRQHQAQPAGRTVPLKAVVGVHLYGQPADLPALEAITRQHGLTLIEDCAQSHGASLGGRATGTWGRAAAFSFYPTKNLGALGDGGAVVTSDPEVARQARLLREYGWQERYVSHIPGLNSRLDEVQAAVLRVKLRHLEAENQRRQALARRYDEAVTAAGLTAPAVAAQATHVFHQYVVRTPARDRLRAFLGERGVGTLIHYPVPIHLQPAYRDRLELAPGGLPETEAAAREVLSLPMFPQLTDEQVERVCEALREWSRHETIP